MGKIFVVVTLALSAIAYNAAAMEQPSKEDRLDTPALSQCLANANDIEVEMGSCYNDELSKQDNALNVTYHNISSTLPAAGQAQLKASERLWIKHRDHVCNQFGEESAAEQATDQASCSVAETEARILYLRKLGR